MMTDVRTFSFECCACHQVIHANEQIIEVALGVVIGPDVIRFGSSAHYHKQCLPALGAAKATDIPSPAIAEVPAPANSTPKAKPVVQRSDVLSCLGDF